MKPSLRTNMLWLSLYMSAFLALVSVPVLVIRHHYAQSPGINYPCAVDQASKSLGITTSTTVVIYYAKNSAGYDTPVFLTPTPEDCA